MAQASFLEFINKMGKVTRRYYDQTEVLYAYNTSGELIKATDEDKKSEEYTYDKNGNLLTLKQKDGTVITYTYDANQNLLSKPDAAFTYDAAGNTTQVVWDAKTIKYEYDAYGNRTKIVYPDNTSITYQYDLSGRMTKTVNASHYSNYEYDALGRMTKEWMCNNVVITKSYDNNGNLLTQLTKLGTRTLSSYTYVYNDINSVIQETEILNGTTTVKDYSYNENDELIKTVKKQGSSTTTTEYVITLTGNKTEVTEGQVTYRATYDDFNRIKTYYDGTYHITYAYDANGNRIREGRDDNTVKEYTYNKLNQLVSVKDFDGTVTTYAYDGAGNRIRQTADRTNTVAKTSPAALSDSIDTFIQQLKQTPSEALETHQTENKVQTRAVTGNTTTIDYLNDELAEYPVVLVKTQDKAATKYWYGNERLCTNEDFYLYDGQGSVTILLSGYNSILSTYSYSDYGRRDKKYNPFTSGSDEYGYRSEAHNSDETQYLRARYYDTVTELFISADGYRGNWQDPLSQNRYNYGRNNPNKYFDPTGFKSIVPIGGGIYNPPSQPKKKPISNGTVNQHTKPQTKGGATNKGGGGSANSGSGAGRNTSSSSSKTNSNNAAEIARRAAEETARRIAEEAKRAAELIKKQTEEKQSQLVKAMKNIVEKMTVAVKDVVLNNLTHETANLNKKYPEVTGTLEERVNVICGKPKEEKKDTENKGDLLNTINNGIKSAGVAVSEIFQSSEFLTLSLSIVLDKTIDKYLPMKGILNAISIFGISAGLTEKIPLNAGDEGKLAEKIPLDKELEYLEKLPGISIRKDLVIDLPLNIKGNQDYLEKIKIRNEQTFVEEIPWDEVIENAYKSEIGNIVKGIPGDFKEVYKCKEYANYLEKSLKEVGIEGERVIIKSKTGYIYSDKYGGNISTNGIHEAIKVGNKVYDNMTPDGMDYNAWLNDLGIDDIPWEFEIDFKLIK